MPAGTSAEIMHFEGMADLIGVIKDRAESLRRRVLQFVIDDLRSGAESGISLEYRLFAYSTYLSELEDQGTLFLNDLARIILKTAGKWPADAQVELKVDWGPRFPVDVTARLANAEKRLGLFGKIPETIEKEARAEGYTDDEVEAILANADRTNEASLANQEVMAAGGGIVGANKVDQMRQSRVAHPTAAARLAVPSHEMGKLPMPPSIA